MRSIVIRNAGPAEQAMKLEGVPDPTPKSDEVVIEIEACGVCFHDVVTRNGTLKAGIRMPLIPGHEIAGTVVETGQDVTTVTIGDRVATTQRARVCGHCRYCRSQREPLCDDSEFLGDAGFNGGYAEYVAVSEDNIAKVPDDVPLDAAAVTACAIGTMYHAIRSVGKVRLAERVLITGASGGLGIHGVQLARQSGAFVVAQTTSEDKTELLHEAGADSVVVARRGEDFSAQVKEATGGRGVDVAIDNVGTPIFTSTRRSIAKGGRWVMVGQLTGDFVPFNPAQLFLKSISMLSATSTTREELRDCLDLLCSGEIRAVIGDTFPLEDASKAHLIMEDGLATGRIVLLPKGLKKLVANEIGL
jgi:acryloyl-coenzyme A reductase